MTHRDLVLIAREAHERQEFALRRRSRPPLNPQPTWALLGVACLLVGAIVSLTQCMADTPVPAVVGASLAVMVVGIWMLCEWWWK